MRRKKKFFWGLLLFMVLFLSGCSKNDIVIKNNIILRGKEKKLYLIADEDIVCNNIHDVWIIDDYVYGWFYSRENKYMMFIFDVSTKTIQIDNEAKNKIHKLKLPLNNWTDYSEIFGQHITNPNRRNMFFQNIIAFSALGCTYADAKEDIKNEIKEIVSELKSLQQDKLKFTTKDFSSFVQNIQNISPEMTPEEIEKLLGKPTKKYSHGQFKSHNPDSFTFFRYELLTTISPKPFYCVTIMFSKNKGKILSVYSDTNLSQFSSKKKGNGAIP